MSKHMFIRSILPIGLLFSGSLILSNTAYLYLSVAYIQMLKVGLIAFLPESHDIHLIIRHLPPWQSSSSPGQVRYKSLTAN